MHGPHATSPVLRTTPKRHPVPPGRKPDAELRPRFYLTPDEVEILIKAAATGITGHRDATMILLAYRHGLRVSELVNLRWDHIDFRRAKLHVRRAKKGAEFAHPLTARETRALQRLKRESPPSAFVFVTWNGRPLTIAGFAKMLTRLGAELGWNWSPHPHVLRHACGYKLANDGVDTRTIQDYLGHRNIRHTVTYTALSEYKFRDLWTD